MNLMTAADTETEPRGHVDFDHPFDRGLESRSELGCHRLDFVFSQKRKSLTVDWSSSKDIIIIIIIIIISYHRFPFT
jgi:hypothetical protein